MYGKKEPVALLWFQLDVWGGGVIFKFRAMVTTPPPLVRGVTKRLGKTRVKFLLVSYVYNYILVFIFP